MSEDIRDLLVRELRQAVTDRIADGAHPDEITAGLALRLRRLRQLQEDEPRSGRTLRVEQEDAHCAIAVASSSTSTSGSKRDSTPISDAGGSG